MPNTSFVSFSDIDTIQNSGATAMKASDRAGEIERELHRLEHRGARSASSAKSLLRARPQP